MEGWKSYVLPLVASIVLLLYFAWQWSRPTEPATGTAATAQP